MIAAVAETPIRVHPSRSNSSTWSRVRIPPEALIATAAGATARIQRTASTVAPRVENAPLSCRTNPNPVEVLRKSTPSSDTTRLIVSIWARVRKSISKITFRHAPNPPQTARTARTSSASAPHS